MSEGEYIKRTSAIPASIGSSGKGFPLYQSCDLKMKKTQCLDSARILKLEASRPSGEERGESVRRRCLVSKSSLQQQYIYLFCVRDLNTDDSSP